MKDVLTWLSPNTDRWSLTKWKHFPPSNIYLSDAWTSAICLPVAALVALFTWQRFLKLPHGGSKCLQVPGLALLASHSLWRQRCHGYLPDAVLLSLLFKIGKCSIVPCILMCIKIVEEGAEIGGVLLDWSERFVFQSHQWQPSCFGRRKMSISSTHPVSLFLKRVLWLSCSPPCFLHPPTPTPTPHSPHILSLAQLSLGSSETDDPAGVLALCSSSGLASRGGEKTTCWAGSLLLRHMLACLVRNKKKKAKGFWKECTQLMWTTFLSYLNSLHTTLIKNPQTWFRGCCHIGLLMLQPSLMLPNQNWFTLYRNRCDSSLNRHQTNSKIKSDLHFAPLYHSSTKL